MFSPTCSLCCDFLVCRQFSGKGVLCGRPPGPDGRAAESCSGDAGPGSPWSGGVTRGASWGLSFKVSGTVMYNTQGTFL